MSSELALHAYIFLGNALHLLSHGRCVAGVDGGGEITADELAALNARVEPLTPATIVSGIAELSASQRELLARCGRLCLSRPAQDFQVLLGVEPSEARQVLDWLDAQAE